MIGRHIQTAWQSAVMAGTLVFLVASTDHAEAKGRKPQAGDNGPGVSHVMQAYDKAKALKLLAQDVLNRSDIRSLQQALGNAGKIDGLWGPKTEGAAQRFIDSLSDDDRATISSKLADRYDLTVIYAEAPEIASVATETEEAAPQTVDPVQAAGLLKDKEVALLAFLPVLGKDASKDKIPTEDLKTLKNYFLDMGALAGQAVNHLRGISGADLNETQKAELARYELYLRCAEKVQGSENPLSGLPDTLKEFIKDHTSIVAQLQPAVLYGIMYYGKEQDLRRIASRSLEYREVLRREFADFDKLAKPSSSDIWRMQVYLKAAGFYLGAFDGEAGPGFDDGIRKFKISEGMQREILDVTYQGLGVPLPGKEPSALLDSDTILGVGKDVYYRVWQRIAAGEPAPQDRAVSDNKLPLIVIDPGHGQNSYNGLDIGALGNGLREIDLDPFAEELGRQLHARGYQVVYTRLPHAQLPATGNYGHTLSARRIFAQQMQKELGAQRTIFISPHGDYRPPSSSGARCMTHGTGKVPTNQNTKDLCDFLGQAFSVGTGETRTVIQNPRIGVPGGLDALSFDDISAAFILEMGNLRSAADSGSLKAIIRNPKPVAGNVADTVDRYVKERLPEHSPAPVLEPALKG
ncbi:MAG: N-acetylmuramoyl-L-alanine amidase [Alphaproteobacteria bacterium]|nr:N-acetylmuramoyl-L-alanine amidase [Alphaproteobacteria bacterium]MCD8571040.1 N-acetylmuramoyl-L-alanine amidase [Alphaproteobacteria bacterium]